ncbi:MAG: NAD+ synthase [Nitrososphaerales archaeon]
MKEEKILSEEALKIDCQKTENEIIEFIREIVKKSDAKGVVVGLSGGIDSSVTATLCVKALGPDKVIGLLMPDPGITPLVDINDAKKLASNLGIKTYTIYIDTIVKAFLDSIPIDNKDRMPIANLKARIRMIINYFFANSLNYLVVGTGDRSEALIGYFTKYGDGGVDFLPIAHLYKTQVKQLGKYLGLPKNIIRKPSSPRLWKGQKAIDEIPIDYSLLDLILYAMFDLKIEDKEIALKLNVPLKIVQKVRNLYDRSMHKRMYPPSLRWSD